MRIPIGMLVTSVKCQSDDMAEINGYWYYLQLQVPNSKEQKSFLMSDFLAGKSVQLRLSGTSQQIIDLIGQTDGFDFSDEGSMSQFEALIHGLTHLHLGKDITFDDAGSPRGTSLAMAIDCEVDETAESLKTKLRDKAVELKLSAHWDLAGDVVSDF